MDDFLLPLVTSEEELQRRHDSKAPLIAALPVGSYEQHGRHLVMATDSIIAAFLSHMLATAADFDMMRMPVFPYGTSMEHAGFAGTLSVHASSLERVIRDIVATNAEQQGLEAVAVINCHGGNDVLRTLVTELNAERDKAWVELFPTSDDWREAEEHAGLETNAHDDMHAGERETSLLLYIEQELPQYAGRLVRPSYTGADHLAPDRRHMATAGLRASTASGVAGRPSLATAEKGEAITESMLRSFRRHYDLLATGKNDAGVIYRSARPPVPQRPGVPAMRPGGRSAPATRRGSGSTG